LKLSHLEPLKHTCHAGGVSKTKLPAPKKRPTDVNQLGKFLVDQLTASTEQPSASEISRVMAALGRRGGKIGGNARAAALTPKRRKQIAMDAAKKRWEGKAAK
jgi:hypothetical protein